MNIKHIAFVAALAVGALPAAIAGTTSSGVEGGGKGVVPTELAPTPAVDDSSIFDKIWALPKIHDAFNLVGRWQGQLWHSDSEDPGALGEDSDYETRRFRLGAAGDLGFADYEVQWNINDSLDNGGEFFEGIDSATIGFDAGGLGVTLGKMKPQVSGEYNTSSKRIKTIERSLLVNQVAPDKIWGASIGGDAGEFGWEGGAFFGGFDEDEDGFTGQWIDTDSNLLLNAGIGYENCKASVLYKTDDDEVNEGAEDYEWILSTSYANYGKKGYEGVGLFGELLYAIGEGDVSDAFGLTVMPSYMVNDELELVLRYHLAVSDDDDGLRTQKRYDRAVFDGRGDTYNGIYAGFNYYIYGDKLKFMTGLEYGDYSGGSDDYSGWTYATGLRFYF